jgi:hypothetical protein
VVQDIVVFLQIGKWLAWLIFAGFLIIIGLLSLLAASADAAQTPVVSWLTLLLYALMMLWMVVFPQAAKSPISRIPFVFFTLLVLLTSAALFSYISLELTRRREVHGPLLILSVAVFCFFGIVVMGKTMEEIYGHNSYNMALGFTISYTVANTAAVAWTVYHKVKPYELAAKALEEYRRQQKK